MARLTARRDRTTMPPVRKKDVAFSVHAQLRFAIIEIPGKHIDDFDPRPRDDPPTRLAGAHVLDAVDQSAKVKGPAVQLDADAVLRENLTDQQMVVRLRVRFDNTYFPYGRRRIASHDTPFRTTLRRFDMLRSYPH